MLKELEELTEKIDVTINAVDGLLSDYLDIIKQKDALVVLGLNGKLRDNHISALEADLINFIDEAFGDSASELKSQAGMLSDINKEAGLESASNVIKSVGQKIIDFVYKIYHNLVNWISQGIAGIITGSANLEKEVKAFILDNKDKKIDAFKFQTHLMETEIPLAVLLTGESMDVFPKATKDYLDMLNFIATNPTSSVTLLLKLNEKGDAHVVTDRDETHFVGYLFNAISKNKKWVMDSDSIKKLDSLKSTTKTIEIMQGRKLVAISTDLVLNSRKEVSLSVNQENIALKLMNKENMDFPEKDDRFDGKLVFDALEKNIKALTSGAAKECYIKKMERKKEIIKKIIDEEYKKISEDSDEVGLFNNIQRYTKTTWKIYPNVFLQAIYSLNSANRHIFSALKESVDNSDSK